MRTDWPSCNGPSPALSTVAWMNTSLPPDCGVRSQPLVRVVPLHRPYHIDDGAEVHLPAGAIEAARTRLEAAAASAAARPRRRAAGPRCRALVNRNHLIDLAAFLALADADRSVAPGLTVWTPAACSELTCRNTSPEPSVRATKP